DALVFLVAVARAVIAAPLIRRRRDVAAAAADGERFVHAGATDVEAGVIPAQLVGVGRQRDRVEVNDKAELLPADGHRVHLALGAQRLAGRDLRVELLAGRIAEDAIRPADPAEVLERALGKADIVRIGRHRIGELPIDVVERRDNAVARRREPAADRFGDGLAIDRSEQRLAHAWVEDCLRLGGLLARLRQRHADAAAPAEAAAAPGPPPTV